MEEMKMNNLKLMRTENFENTISCDFWADINDEYFVTREQIGRALGYSAPEKAIAKIHSRHKESLDKFSVKSEIKNTEGTRIVMRHVTLYSIKGLFLILQYANVSERTKTDLINLVKQLGVDTSHLVTISTRKELSFIDELEDFFSNFNIVGIKQYNVDNKYRIDYYVPCLQIAIEYDENNHQYYNQEKEKERMFYIKNKLRCQFIRVADSDSNSRNLGYVVKQLAKMNLIQYIERRQSYIKNGFNVDYEWVDNIQRKIKIIASVCFDSVNCSYEEIELMCEWIFARIDHKYCSELRCSDLYYLEKYHNDILIDKLDSIKVISCVPELKSLFESIVDNYIEIKATSKIN